ncbi:13928_t:CDS:2, partial [Entrophospora sp. SA101]
QNELTSSPSANDHEYIIDFEGILDDEPKFGSHFNHKFIGMQILDDIIENQRIKNILKEILQITNIDKANEFIDKYKVLINIKLDAESIIDNFIFSVVNIFSGFFILDNNYFKDQYSENHIGAVIYAPLFNNLFRQECYSIRLNDQLLANKERRNLGNEERVRLALVPDIKLTYLRGNMEIIVIEHQKQIILDGLKKNKKDTTKITIMMHDLLTKISKDLDSRELSDHIKNINVFGVITSKLDIEIYSMQMPAPELYVFNKIFEFSLPTNVFDFPEISRALSFLIKFRRIVDQNYFRYINILNNNEPVTPTQQVRWSIKMKTLPISLRSEIDKTNKKRKESK